MDFIAEAILGYADAELAGRISDDKKFCILRYRDDYRIFAKDQSTAEGVLKELSAVLIDLGLRLNPSKTQASDDLISSAYKQDKLAWQAAIPLPYDLPKQLLKIHQFAKQFPNSGALNRALQEFRKRLARCDMGVARSMIAISVDIGRRNPRTYPTCASIVSALLDHIDGKEKRNILDQIHAKFRTLPNTGYMDIWLQRIALAIDRKYQFESDEKLCQLLATRDNKLIWNSDWIADNQLLKAMAEPVIDDQRLRDIEPIIQPDETALFVTNDERLSS